MNEAVGGMPLLSGPPPDTSSNNGYRADISCRKCNKEFNLLFARGRRCNHCGFSYCHSCSDYQALMPRAGTESGYDPVPVCAFCIQFLTITAGGKAYLRSQSIAKLKSYIQAYGLRLGADVIEKDDVIDAIIAARLRNGCLPPDRENFYRQHAVPNGQTTRPRGLFNRTERARQPPRSNIDPSSPWTQSNNFARPDIQSDAPQPPPRPRQQSESRPRATPMPHPRTTRSNDVSSRSYQEQNTPPPYFPNVHQPYERQQHPSFANFSSSHQASSSDREAHRDTRYSYHSNERTDTSLGTPPRPRASVNPPPPPPRPPQPVPSLDELLNMTEDDISRLSVSNLKEFLFQNHVPARQILEKSELVNKVKRLLEDEREERARSQAMHMQEEWEAQERERLRIEAREEEERRRRRRDEFRATVESDSGSETGVQMEPSGGLQTEGEPLIRPRTPPTESSSSTQPDTTSTSAQSSSSMPSTRSHTSTPTQPHPPAHGSPPKPSPVASTAERNGLCVVCQDEESNIVIVDCGHLALCRACADLIMDSTRECPLCRIRIVTKSRLLRVFKS